MVDLLFANRAILNIADYIGLVSPVGEEKKDSLHPRFEPLAYGQKDQCFLRKFACADENRLTRIQARDYQSSNRKKPNE